MSTDAYDKLVEFFHTKARMARRVSQELPKPITPQAVQHWRKKIPVEKCIILERLCGGAVTCYEMRPDIFEAPPKGARRKGRADA